MTNAAIAFVTVMALWPHIPSAADVPPQTVEGIRFYHAPSTLYVPVRDLGVRLGWPVVWNAETGTLYLHNIKVLPFERRTLPDGTFVMPVRHLSGWGAQIRWSAKEKTAFVEYGGVSVRIPATRRIALNDVESAD